MAETSSEFGGALGIAVLGSVVTAFYQGAMRDSLPADLPPGSTEAALDTAGAAMAEALNIGGPSGEALLVAAREAYGTAFQAAAVVCVAVALAAAFVAWRLLRDLSPPSRQGEPVGESVG